jgi:hypothetical protein
MIRWLWLLLLLLLEGGDAGNDDGAEEQDASDDGAEDQGDEEVRDPRALIKSLREANARLAKKLEKKDERITELEGSDGVIRSARLESGFIRAVFGHRDSIDLEAAWDLATMKGYLDGVHIQDDGTVDAEGMDSAIEKLVSRYPYLIQESDSPSTDYTPLPRTRQPRPNATDRNAVDRAALERRYPALRRRRRGGL